MDKSLNTTIQARQGIAVGFALRFTLLASAAFVLPACNDTSARSEPSADEPRERAAATSASPDVPSRQPAAGAEANRDPQSPAAPIASGTTDAAPAPVYRPPDQRPDHDDQRLAALGIHKVESRRLILYSDLPREEIAHLPELVDALYREWVAYFGELPPDRHGGDYQITGYLMKEAERFQSAGLVPVDLPRFEHGRHQGRRFWMHAQHYDYYQEHLLLHEATHCFMTALSESWGPYWYMEGMAEYFALHRRNEAGEVDFGVIPPPPRKMMGFDRIRVIREEIAAGQFMTLDGIARLPPRAFLAKRGYAWSWACCLFFNKHPRYAERFHSLASPSLRQRFPEEIQQTFANNAEVLPIEWALFAHEITPNYQFEEMAIEFPPASRLEPPQPRSLTVSAAAGWQPARVRLVAGRTYRLQAEGRVILANEPRPWRSDPDGITFDYAHGSPLGRLQAAILVDDPSKSPDPAGGLLSPIDIGHKGEITPQATGRLYLRVNDHANNLRNNSGSYELRISSVGK